MNYKIFQVCWSFCIVSTSGLLFAESSGLAKPHLKRQLQEPSYNNAGPVGEVSSINRKKEFGSDRRPAILNLNDELQAITELNSSFLRNQVGPSNTSLVQADSQASTPKEIFFNKFLVVDDQILLFGDELKGVITCKKGNGSLILSEGREINTKKSTPDPNARNLSFQDDQLCKTAFTVLKSDPSGQTRLIVIETLSEKVTRFDIR